MTKRNMVPLLGIAFVAAVIATGVVYGLFGGRLRSKTLEVAGQSIVVAARDLDRGTVIKPADLQLSQVKGVLTGSYSKVDDAVGATLLDGVLKNEPLLENRVASLDPKVPGAGEGLAAGMRAVSIRMSESMGLIGLLHAGARVDVQAVMERNSVAELRTILQNVEVLRVSPFLEPVGTSRLPVPIATLMVPAQSADLIAVADSGARIRIVLRNPLDDGTAPRHSLGLLSVFSGASISEPPTSPQVTTAANAGDPSIQLDVQVLGVSAAALGQLDSKLALAGDNPSGAGLSMRVANFRAGTNAGELVRKLEQTHEAEVVASSHLVASVGRPASMGASAAPYGLHVQFSTSANSLGRISLRVQPEISLRNGPGEETRGYNADLPDGGSFLVKGLLNSHNDAKILGSLYPGHAWNGRELVIFVTTRSRGQSPSAVAQANRGQ